MRRTILIKQAPELTQRIEASLQKAEHHAHSLEEAETLLEAARHETMLLKQVWNASGDNILLELNLQEHIQTIQHRLDSFRETFKILERLPARKLKKPELLHEIIKSYPHDISVNALVQKFEAQALYEQTLLQILQANGPADTAEHNPN